MKDDFGFLKKKDWKKAQIIVEKMNPGYKNENKKMIQRVNNWVERDPINKLVYENKLRFMPTESVMHILLINTAMSLEK